MKRTADEGVSIWFWSRDDFTVPAAVKYGEPAIFPDITWGLPDARFPFTEKCSADHFDAHQIIFDDTFCVRLFFCLVMGLSPMILHINRHRREILQVPYILHQVVLKHV